jgi:hypothetical protein
MSSLRLYVKRSGLPVLLVLCLAALSASYAYADEAARPRALQIIGDPDAAVNGRFAVGTASVGAKALTVVGVIDFLGAGTVHNYFTQGTGNNMQINTNVDEANVVADASRSQWKLVLGSSLDWFSIRRSPAGGTYNEDALFFVQGSTGRVGIATVDTGNGATIPFTLQARLHVETASGQAILGRTSAASASGVFGHASTTTGLAWGVFGQSDSNSGAGVFGQTLATTGSTAGVAGLSASDSGTGVLGTANASAGETYGVRGLSYSSEGTGVYGNGVHYGVYGQSASTYGFGVFGTVTATTGANIGVYGQSASTYGRGVYGTATATTGESVGVFGGSDSTSGRGVSGYASASTGTTFGVSGQSDSTAGRGVSGWATATTGANYGVYGRTDSSSGYGVYFSGGLAGTGTKSAIVQTQDYGWRHLYSVESPQNWFEDFGQATLVGGEAVVPIEPIFAQSVNLDEGYHVFLTPRGGFCSLYVAETSSTDFTVRALEGAGCEIAFDYRIVAPRLDYEDLRLEPAEDPEAVAASLPAAQ